MGLVQTKTEISIETSPQLIESLHMAREVALKSDVAEVLPAHLVLAMLEDDESSFLLDAYGVDFNKLRTQLGKIVQKQAKPKSGDRHAVFSAGIEAVMQHAREQAQKNALAEVDSNLILAVILSEKKGFMASLLAPYDLDTSGVLQYLELREGKTVNIAPLPSQQSPANHSTNKAQRPPSAPAPAPAPAPQKTPARASAPVAPTPAPVRAPAPTPVRAPTPAPAPARTDRPAASNQTAGTPAPRPQPSPRMPQDHQAGFPPKAPVPAPNASPMPVAPRRNAPPATPPTANRNRTPTTTPPTPLAQSLSKLSRQLKGKPLPQSGAALSSSPPAATASSEAASSEAASSEAASSEAASSEAPSRMRSLFGNMGKKLKDVALKSEESPTPSTPPPTAPSTLAPIPANNNQSPPAAPATSKQPAALRPAPVLASVEQLVDPASMAHLDTPNTAQLNQHNRHTKRRRAVPSSLGSNESMSATGSVLEKGRLVEAVPRKMKMNKPSRAEVRITREQLDEINSEFEDLSSNHIHELAVTEAMTVQLRAPGSGFHIENLSPQTQWIDRNQRHINDADFGVWRWNVTPVKSGKARLQLVISARTVDDDGNIHIADIPDKIIELSIAKDYGNGLKKLGFITFLVISSLALGRYGEAAWQWASLFISRLGSAI